MLLHQLSRVPSCLHEPNGRKRAQQHLQQPHIARRANITGALSLSLWRLDQVSASHATWPSLLLECAVQHCPRLCLDLGRAGCQLAVQQPACLPACDTYLLLPAAGSPLRGAPSANTAPFTTDSLVSSRMPGRLHAAAPRASTCSHHTCAHTATLSVMVARWRAADLLQNVPGTRRQLVALLHLHAAITAGAKGWRRLLLVQAAGHLAPHCSCSRCGISSTVWLLATALARLGCGPAPGTHT